MMWYMIASELQKLWRRKAFLIMLFVIVATNVAMLFYSSRKTDIPDKAYKAFDHHLQNMSEKEREAYICEYAERIEGLVFIENINLFAANRENGSEIAEAMINENPELYDKYYKDWKDKNYILYTEDIFEEDSFMQDVRKRITQTMEYDKYLEDIAAKEEDTLGISIFANSGNDETKENVFSKKVIRQTAEKYRKISGVKTDVYTYRWIDNFTSEGILEILFTLLTFILVYQMIYEEKRKYLFCIIRAMPRGRTGCVVSKMIALFINTGLVTFLMYGVIFVYSAITVGIYGLEAPIQSVAEFIACPYKLSIWQFMILVVMTKWLVLFVFGLILLLISILVSHYVITFVMGISILGVGAIEYCLVSGASKWNLFHYLNLWQFLKSEQVIGNYVLLNIFEKPQSVCSLMFVMVLIMSVLFALACIVTFAVSKNLLNHSKVGLGAWLMKKSASFKGTKAFKNRISQIGLKQRIYKRVWGYESYKIFVMNLGILLIVLFGVGMVVTGKNTSCYLTPNETCYRQWMQNLNGQLTNEKEERIQNQKVYYEEILQQLEELDQAFQNDEMSEEEYDSRKLNLESQLAFYPAFCRVYERYEYVKKDSNRQFVYEEGYNKLMGKKDHWYLSMFMMIDLVLILFLTTAFTTDKEKGMYHIIRTTPKGRTSVIRSKVAICFIGVCVMYLCFFLRNIYIAQKNYGMESLFTSASNLKGLEIVPSGVSILLLLIGFALLQMICLLVISALIMFVSNRIGNTVHAIVWEIIVLVIVVVVVNQIYMFMIS